VACKNGQTAGDLRPFCRLGVEKTKKTSCFYNGKVRRLGERNSTKIISARVDNNHKKNHLLL